MNNDHQSNILLFTLEYPPYKGGVANYYGNMITHWPSNNIYILTNKNRGEQALNAVYYRTLVSNYILPKWLPAFLHLARTIKKHNIEHVIVGHILPLGTVTLFLSKVLKFKYTVVLHGMDAAWALKKKRKRQMAQKILKQAQHIICANSHVNRVITEILPPENDAKIHVINPGITDTPPEVTDAEIEEIKKEYGVHDKFLLLSVGRLVARKGFQQVIKAFPHISKNIDTVVYVIAGTGPFENQLKQEVSQLDPDLQSKIIFLGSIADKEKWKWLKACDIFIMPSMNFDGDFEGFGIVYLEANIMGKPVIAGEEGGVTDAVEHKTNGLVVDPRNPDNIAQAVHHLTIDKELREKLGRQGKQRANNNFDWEKQISKIFRIINNR